MTWRPYLVMLFVVPGETMLIAASIYAGTTHDLDIALVIAAASCGAVLGEILAMRCSCAFTAISALTSAN